MASKHLGLVVLLLSTVLVAVFAEEEKYDSKYDHVDVDGILASSKLRSQYVSCFLGTGPCITADAKYFRDVFPEAFITKCRKCTPKQQDHLDKISGWFSENDPETWTLIVSKALKSAQEKAAKRK